MMTIKVNGSDVTIEFEKILSLPRGMMIADWGWKLAEAELELAQADISYRAWRATFGNEVCAGSKKGTPPEWRVKTKIEAHPNFATYKQGIAKAHYNVRLLASVVDALQASMDGQSRSIVEGAKEVVRGSE